MSDRSRAVLGFPAEAWQAFVTALPGPVGFRLRGDFWRPRLKHMGRDVAIGVGVQLVRPEFIELADNCWIDRNVLILAGPPSPGRHTQTKEIPGFPLETGDVYIGENVHVAPNSVLSGMGGLFVGKNTTIAANSTVYSFSHHYRFGPGAGAYQASFTSRARRDQQSMILGPVLIGEYCAVGLGSTILPGTSLGRGTWIACNQVVRGTYAAQSLVRDEARGDVASLADLRILE